MENSLMVKPTISRAAFWDVDFDQIDFQEKDLFVMEKVPNYGTWDDFINVIRFYGVNRFKKRIIFAAYLKKDVLNFICVAFDLHINDFKSYTRRQSQNQPWNF
ncbi:DUF6922 domain-containing protein [Dyadobacter sp. BHUBP1]|uniref:DUF6922 domain-containing protein n=1 Tax=Dyadobacter sp. BHUBP1 TaxID=3424178 RepID=UPI003D32AE46